MNHEEDQILVERASAPTFVNLEHLGLMPTTAAPFESQTGLHKADETANLISGRTNAKTVVGCRTEDQVKLSNYAALSFYERVLRR